MTTLLCGSLAYDTIMVFPEPFKNHILSEQIHILNVSFLVPDLRREYGGCAGNIAWNLRLLGERPRIMATLGAQDGALYLQRLRHHGFDVEHIRMIDGSYTAQAFITTDIDDNQITAFHPGAMDHAHVNPIPALGDIELAIISPDGRQGMIEHARDLAAANIPFVFDPGQGLPMFSKKELDSFIEQARWCIVNDYEAQLLCQRTQYSLEDISRRLDALIVTRGHEGSVIYTANACINIPCVPVSTASDPTGCGDAYRAGLLYGLARQWPWLKIGRLASVMGAFKIEHRGGQNHKPSKNQIATRYQEVFGEGL
jgi:adenosine kinase